MRLLVSFALAAAPALLLLRYYYRQDKARPEPKGLVLRVFLFGLLSALIAIPLEFAVSTLQGLFVERSLIYYLFKAFVVAGLVEELLKLAVVRLTVYKNKSFDEIMDGVVYTVVASLGFACMENILYVFSGSLATALIRAFTAVPLHATVSGLMGYYVGKARFASSREAEKALLGRGLTVAVLLHGSYDFLLFVMPLWGPVPALGVIPLILAAFFTLRRKIRTAIAADRNSGRAELGEGEGI